ncbi:hypothetical protein WN48_08114 [Eufriesea mexicana]|uniref:Uncharacterized protein n=1 Tax=Eufriesea mexicana TaxID=516756 RepID=A0A310S823_9HYME|nr:hypothetical protein WN48_08114 [Eufriesea mexicana]
MPAGSTGSSPSIDDPADTRHLSQPDLASKIGYHFYDVNAIFPFGVLVSRKKNFPISDAHFGERSCPDPVRNVGLASFTAGELAPGCTRAITNYQAYTDDEQKHWFDKNDYRWLHERGVCTRPALVTSGQNQENRLKDRSIDICRDNGE